MLKGNGRFDRLRIAIRGSTQHFRRQVAYQPPSRVGGSAAGREVGLIRRGCRTGRRPDGWVSNFGKVDELRPGMGRKYLAAVVATLWPKHQTDDPERGAVQWVTERQRQ